jgi:hypothetical protein
MSQLSARLRRGDLVEVKAPDEILQTLDADGAVDNLPFMPEMLEFCGRRFHVASRALTVCFSGPGGSPRAFRSEDVVTLEGLRCSGAAHDGCQKACMIFWREAWLRKAEDTIVRAEVGLDTSALKARLKTSNGPETYYCQASELSKSTALLSRRERFARYYDGLRVGNFNASRMAHDIRIWLFGKFHRIFLGVYPRGNNKSTPVESLNLQHGEWVEVKPLKDIIETLNERGHNRGLYFSPDMGLICGRRRRVKGRIDKLVVDGTGEMRQLRNTVCLEGSTCGCAYLGGFGAGGCSRCELVYWREIWLRRSDSDSAAPASQDRVNLSTSSTVSASQTDFERKTIADREFASSST